MIFQLNLKDLKVDGVGMGIELAAEGFRESSIGSQVSKRRFMLLIY